MRHQTSYQYSVKGEKDCSKIGVDVSFGSSFEPFRTSVRLPDEHFSSTVISQPGKVHTVTSNFASLLFYPIFIRHNLHARTGLTVVGII